MNIIELRNESEMKEAYQVICQLRPYLDEATYIERLRLMVRRGYRQFAIRDAKSNGIVALAGIAINVNFYHGRHLWIYDLVTDEKSRSQGYGRALLKHIEEFARSENCEAIATESGTWRKDAHRFYGEQMGYECTSYEFKKMLK